MFRETPSSIIHLLSQLLILALSESRVVNRINNRFSFRFYFFSKFLEKNCRSENEPLVLKNDSFLKEIHYESAL